MRRRYENFHSRLVAWMKILLPLAALSILSSVVFFARENEDVRDIPFLMTGETDAPDQRIAAPEYQALTDDGARVKLTAREVTPSEEDEGWLDISNVAGRIETRSGRVFQATAPGGRVNFSVDEAELSGIVSVDTSDGFHMLSDALRLKLDSTFAETGGAVRGEAPFGVLEAGGMRLGEAEGSLGSELMVFNGGVKLVYQPRQ
ncbi:LPS export ABC transporter periplasmic protein LptC [Ovoidimarina sediminis]|uniref:LPS export ABC transporter periplasmic protein LptC n=1 Tax=Ovoidimarina sediminis TaxID=3079856 RepID=UPI0029077247|nr:hypothetical protein [Rhodophyticola sp. MJ-SS7]MDU8942388.1 hypothetical protein [Rhodophyticola sp. MJ-SS7]